MELCYCISSSGNVGGSGVISPEMGLLRSIMIMCVEADSTAGTCGCGQWPTQDINSTSGIFIAIMYYCDTSTYTAGYIHSMQAIICCLPVFLYRYISEIQYLHCSYLLYYRIKFNEQDAAHSNTLYSDRLKTTINSINFLRLLAESERCCRSLHAVFLT